MKREMLYALNRNSSSDSDFWSAFRLIQTPGDFNWRKAFRIAGTLTGGGVLIALLVGNWG